MKLERLISIIYKLLNHDVLSASVLAEEYRVSQRTIYRDIDAICAAGFPVVSHTGYKGGFGIMEGYKMDRSLLGSYDVDALIAVLHGLSSVFADERAQGTIERLQTIGPEHRTNPLEVNLENRRAEPESLPLLRKAIAERKSVRFDYINAKNERSERNLEPLRLLFKYSNWYVYGFCRSRRDYREFRLSRMMNAELTQEAFAPHDEAPNGEPPSFGNREELLEDVVIQIRPETIAEALDQFSNAKKQFLDDGSMRITVSVRKPLEARWLWSILLGFGDGAEVLEPRELRGILKERLRKALGYYEEA